jgi:hypothetical protein
MSAKDVARIDVAALPALDLADIEDESTETLIARGAAYAREHAKIEGKAEILAGNIATVLIALRKRHDDWLGRSTEYRKDASEVYLSANIRDKDQLTRLQNNVRYHVGNQLRRHLTPRELKALELRDASPIERMRDRRETNGAIIRATTASLSAEASSPTKGKGKTKTDEPAPDRSPGIVVKATADHLRLATVARGLVTQMDTDVIASDMTDGQRAKLDEELAAVEREVRRLRRLLKKPRSEA